MLKKCPSDSVCFKQLRDQMLRKTKQQMLNEYERWLAKNQEDDAEDDGSC
jgi:hypothetical protein